MSEFGFTNDASQLESVVAFREAAIADGWACRQNSGNEPMEQWARLDRDGWVMHVLARTKTGGKWKYQAQVSIWGPDGLYIKPPVVYDFRAIEAYLRTCMDCGKPDVDTQRVGFAGRVCEACLPAARKRDEYPGWTN